VTVAGDDFYCAEALSGRTAVEVVLETDEVLAFRHTRPFWPVHIVVAPKTHVPSLLDLGDAGEALLHKVLAVVRRVAEPKHLHFHVNSGEPLPSGEADRLG
jgi:histidine triad (HIT) family protein